MRLSILFLRFLTCFCIIHPGLPPSSGRVLRTILRRRGLGRGWGSRKGGMPPLCPGIVHAISRGCVSDRAGRECRHHGMAWGRPSRRGHRKGRHRLGMRIVTFSANEESARSGRLGPSTQAAKFFNERRGRLRETTEKIRAFGLAGVLAYGFFNTAYYVVGFSLAWAATVQAGGITGGASLQEATQRVLAVLGTVWLGSQVTKLLRAGLALGGAPLCDKFLTFCVDRGMPSKSVALGACTVACVGLFAAVFSVAILSQLA